jgi:hypothetical protein
MGKIMTISTPDFRRGVSDMYSLKPLRRAISAVAHEITKTQTDSKPKSRETSVASTTRGYTQKQR